MKMKNRKLLTQAKLRHLLHYDPLSGIWSWRIPAGRRVHTGDLAGTMHNCSGGPYRRIKISGHLYSAHRLAFLYMLGRWDNSTTSSCT